MNCKHCGAPLLVVEGQKVLHCDYCGSNELQDASRLEAGFLQGWQRLQIPMPKGFSVEKRNHELKITRDWFNWGVIAITFFCVVWDGFLVFWYGIAISHHVWIMAAFGSLHAAAGLAITYSALTGWLNETVIKVNTSRLEVTSGPLPVPGNKQLQASYIKQLYSRQKISRNKQTTFSYEVHAITVDQKDETVLAGLTDSAQALYIEQEIERALGIKDQPVRGELAR